MKHLNQYVPLFVENDFPLISNWAKELLALEPANNSSPSDFEGI